MRTLLILSLLILAVLAGPSLAQAAPHWEADINIVAGTGAGGPASSYRIERKVGTAAYTVLAPSVQAGVTVDPLVPEFVQVCYRWFAVNAVGSSVASDEDCGIAGTLPAKPGGSVNFRFVAQ